MTFGGEALRALDVPDEEIDAIVADVRRRDEERLQMQSTGGTYAGRDLMRGNEPTPGPLTKPKRTARPLTEETAVVADEPDGGVSPG